MKAEDIIKAYTTIRNIDNTIPDDVLDFMKNSAIKQLKLCRVVWQSEQLVCAKENISCEYLKNHNKCGLRKRWCNYQTN